jgi:glycosyltransferase involved in cell wall biosynthesis
VLSKRLRDDRLGVGEAPLVSVIIPVYNSGRTLDRCLESVARQSYRNWETIIVDSQSVDNTSQIASMWCDKLGSRRCQYYKIEKRPQAFVTTCVTRVY